MATPGLRVNSTDSEPGAMRVPSQFRMLGAMFIVGAILGGCLTGSAQAGTLREARAAAIQARQSSISERMSQRIAVLRANNSAQFDRTNPFMARLLTQQNFLNYWVSRWQAHPARFQYWHPRFWHILDSVPPLQETPTGTPPIVSPEVIPPVPQLIDPPPDGNSTDPPPGTPTDPTDPTNPTNPTNPTDPTNPGGGSNSIPEPASLQMIAVAMTALLATRYGLRGRKQ